MEMGDPADGFSVVVDPFDDGHQPALAQNRGETKLARNLGKAHTSFVSVFDDLLPDPWSGRIYDYAISRRKPWGIYVQTKDLVDLSQATLLENLESLWHSDPERAFAMCATYMLVMKRGRGSVGCDIEHIHGTAVWCLCSGVTNSVEYHIDYAELYRYETNVIHPPLYAGTCHVTPLGVGGDSIKGGAFCVNMGGIEHYKAFGYKAKLKGAKALEEDMANNSNWFTVRYKANRGIFHDGDLPHLSTPVEYLPADTQRVILGFNCFTSDVGECCIRAPEHSRAFNRTVKLYQAMAAASGSGGDALGKYSGEKQTVFLGASRNSAEGLIGSCDSQPAAKSQFSAKEVLKNPALAKLLVLAARKVKERGPILPDP
jgi:hypothetical protein